ncbi:TPA: DUF402 domain-containing protein, partial [Staphylococcus aureus]|nr:DUF402 domain-containing protein [Staphylococcus aureus]
KRYSITVMFDNKGNPLEYYFDINIKNITQKGNARTVDLYLDVLALPSGEYELVDEDDLMFALESEQITKKQFHEAYMIAHQIMAELENDFKGFQKKIMYCFNKINAKAQKNHQKPQNKTNIEKSKQIKPKQYNQTKNHQQQKKN